jgi:allophanate hydrolase subunit 2
LRGGFGGVEGRALRADDALPVGFPPRPPLELAGRHIPKKKRPAYDERLTVEVILGPQVDRFTEEGREAFLSSEYTISLSSDRMGYRLEGPPVAHTAGADIISDGLVAGSIQVPASGQPIVMMADHPTTGGYPKIATVVSADLPLLAQCPPGTGRLRFRETTVKAAQARWRAMMNGLKASIDEPDEDRSQL